MGISSALYSGVSGLNTNASAMSVIGNNLANTNTLGFKGSRSVFSDLLSATVSGSGGESQVGRGVGMSKVDQIFSQGTFETTESNLDVAIEGEGFFILKNPGEETAYYSRAGAFRFNEDGYLVNPEGYRVQGKLFDANGVLVPGDATDIQVLNTGLVEGNVTTEIELTTNLDSSSDLKTIAGFDITDPTTYNYASTVTIYDTLGNPQLLTTYFVKTADNTWNATWHANDEGGADLGAIDGTNPALFQEITFNTDGSITGPTSLDTGLVDWDNGSDPTAIEIKFDTTQFNSDSIVLSQDQNGFGAGSLIDVEFDDEGIVTAQYSNGRLRKIGWLVLGKFSNPGGLSLAGSNLYTETRESGVPRVGLPDPELGQVFTNSLEQSNIDMGAEFVRMITVQRGFQANSKIITTVDELLGELINLKR